MRWEDAVNEAKRKLCISGYTNEWNKVISLAKEIYWKGQNFKELKEDTIYMAEGECKLCHTTKRLTAHHIYYKNDITICLCKNCHKIVHEIQREYGFVMQLILDYWDDMEYIKNEYFNLYETCLDCKIELIKAINKID